MTVYFCWLCDKQVDGRLYDEHYESGRVIFFCSLKHQDMHRVLKVL
jgi:hypothetical protein